MLLLRDLRAELLRACGLWALSPARGTTVRLLLRSYAPLALAMLTALHHVLRAEIVQEFELLVDIG